MMTRTVVIQYVPDAVTNERINIGVVALSNGKARSLFLNKWGRVKQFSGTDISFLRDIVHESKKWDEETVLRLTSQWTGSIQFSAPKYTTYSTEEALFDAGTRYLTERASATASYRGKSDAVKVVRSRIREKLIDRFGPSGRVLVRDKNYELKGKNLSYEFDISVANGKPYFAAQGISFEVPDTRHLEKEVASTAWLIRDVRRQSPDFPIGVAVFEPKDESTVNLEKIYKGALLTFEEEGAKIVKEHQISQWAEEMILSVLPSDLRRNRI